MRVIDLSLPIDNEMRGVDIRQTKRLSDDGWNARTLSLYSHSGTHMDAPCHFLPDGGTLDQLSLDVLMGEAIVVDLTPVKPRELLTVDRVAGIVGDVRPGARLLLRTDWYHRHGTPEYRDRLPRISPELARWFVRNRVALIGVEPPSVADVNDMEELTEVHQILFRGDVIVVEGLAFLDRISSATVQFVALPLRIVDGDGSPVRAVAIET